jgi:hypothetical protein
VPLKKVVNQKNHGSALFSLGGKNAVELIQATATIDNVANHFKIPESRRHMQKD